MNKFLALVRRSLQTEARLVRGHLSRCLLAGFVLWTLFTSQWEIFRQGAPGLNLFRSISYYNYFFITILGTAFFATSITEEKEERTLGLLKMAGVGPTSLILGKWTPRMISAFLLVAIQIPFTALATTLGGVLWDQIQAAYLSLFAHLFLIGSIGLFFSVISASTTAACGWALALIGVYLIGPSMTAGIFGDAQGTFIGDAILWTAEHIQNMNAYSKLGDILTTGFKASGWNYQFWSNLCVGSAFLIASWSLFERFTANEKSQNELSMFDHMRKKLKTRERSRVWNSAIVWKEYQFLGGGTAYLWMKFFFYFFGILGLTVLMGVRSSYFFETLGGMLFGWSLFLIVVEIAIMTARLYRSELHQKTWATLVLLPRPTSEILYAKLLGGLSVIQPQLVCLTLGVLLLGEEFLEAIGSILSEPDLGTIFFAFSYFILQIVLSIHVSTLLSITQSWASWPIAVFLAGFLVFIANVTAISCLVFVISESGFLALTSVGCVATLAVIIAIHAAIGRKLYDLAGE